MVYRSHRKGATIGIVDLKNFREEKSLRRF
jgi:hypothetical protein